MSRGGGGGGGGNGDADNFLSMDDFVNLWMELSVAQPNPWEKQRMMLQMGSGGQPQSRNQISLKPHSSSSVTRHQATKIPTAPLTRQQPQPQQQPKAFKNKMFAGGVGQSPPIGSAPLSPPGNSLPPFSLKSITKPSPPKYPRPPASLKSPYGSKTTLLSSNTVSSARGMMMMRKKMVGRSGIVPPSPKSGGGGGFGGESARCVRLLAPVVECRIDHRHEQVAVLDYSFCEVKNLGELSTMAPRFADMKYKPPPPTSSMLPEIGGGKNRTQRGGDDDDGVMSYRSMADSQHSPLSARAESRTSINGGGGGYYDTGEVGSVMSFNSDRSPNATTNDSSLTGPTSGTAAAATPMYHASIFKLHNNSIEDLSQLGSVITTLIVTPARSLTIIDLSFNNITSLPKNWPDIPLNKLYLHANAIPTLEEVEKLAPLRNSLTYLTLHGNPIVYRKGYKLWTISFFPKLKSLDFSFITPQDRDDSVWVGGVAGVVSSGKSGRGGGGSANGQKQRTKPPS